MMIETFTEHRRTLFGIAYRMLGSVSDAEDLLQEVWLRWQRQTGSAIQSPKAWLVSTTTRLCIDQFRSARRMREEYYGVWLPEPLTASTTTAPDSAVGLSDSLTMAFMLMLESLGPVERAAFLLHEVFDYDYATTAEIIGKSEANCRQIICRAHGHLQAQAKAPPPPGEQAEQLVEEFLAAAETGQINRLLALLAEDAVVYSDGGGRVKAAGRPIISADHASRFIIGIWPRLPAGTKWQPASINDRPGYLMHAGDELYCALSFDLAGDRIRNLYFVLNPEKLRHLKERSSNT